MHCRWTSKLPPALVVIGLMASCVGIFAQEAAKPKPQPKKIETVDGHADVVKTIWGSKTEVLMTGNVRFNSKDTTLTSDKVTYDKQTKTAVSPGKLTITNPECDITGDKGTAYFEKRLGVVEGSVEMLLKPKKDETLDKDSVKARMTEPTTVTCPKLEYLYSSKIATASGGVLFKQPKRSARADKAVYDGKKELLVLTGSPVDGIDEDGQTFKAPKVTISLKKGDEWMEATGGFSGSFKVDLEEDSGGRQ